MQSVRLGWHVILDFAGRHRATIGIGAGLLVISTQFCHADLAYIAWKAHFVANGRLDVYRAIAETAPERLADTTYPPLAYWLFGAWLAIGRGLFGVLRQGFELGAAWVAPVHLRHLDAVWFRLLYLPFLLWLGPLTVRMLRRMGLDAKADPKALAWFAMTQPALLLPTFMVGQFDLIPAALSFAGVLYLAEGAAFAGVLCLTAGTLMKLYPVAIMAVVLPLSLVLHRDRAYRLRATAASLMALGFTAAVFLCLRGEALNSSVLRLSHTSYTVAAAALGIGFKTYGLVLLLVALLSLPVAARLFGGEGTLGSWLRRRLRQQPSPQTTARLLFFAATATVAVILVDRLWQPHYLAWAVPFFATAALYVTLRTRTSRPIVGLVIFSLAALAATWVGRPRDYYIKGHFFLDRWPEALRPPLWLPWSVVSAYAIIQIGKALHESYVALSEAPLAPVFDDAAATRLRCAGTWLAVGFFSYAALHLIVSTR